MYHYKLGMEKNDASQVLDLFHVEAYPQDMFDNMVFQATLAVAEAAKCSQEAEYDMLQERHSELLEEARSMNDPYLINWYENLLAQEFQANITFENIILQVGEYLINFYGFTLSNTQAGSWIFGLDNLADPIDRYGHRDGDIFLRGLCETFQTKIHKNTAEYKELLATHHLNSDQWINVAERMMQIPLNTTDIETEEDHDEQ